ncbi:hypothetical protein D3C81_338250 [compost metagenome]
MRKIKIPSKEAAIMSTMKLNPGGAMSICVMPANGEPIIRLEVKEILQNDLQVNITSTA